MVFCLDGIQSWKYVCVGVCVCVCVCVCVFEGETGHDSLPLTSFFSVSSSLFPISSRTPLTLMMADSSGREENKRGFCFLTALRKPAASVA